MITIAKVSLKTSLLQQPLLKFAIVGVSGTVIKLGTLYFLTDIAGLFYIASYGVAFILSVVSNYVLNSRWTFKTANGKFVKYLTISCITLSLNLGLIYLLTDLLGIWYMLSGAVAILSAFLINFTLSKRYVWRNR